MIYLSASEVKRNFAEFLDQAQKEPVTIQGQNEDLVVVLSVSELTGGQSWLKSLYCKSLKEKSIQKIKPISGSTPT